MMPISEIFFRESQIQYEKCYMCSTLNIQFSDLPWQELVIRKENGDESVLGAVCGFCQRTHSDEDYLGHFSFARFQTRNQLQAEGGLNEELQNQIKFYDQLFAAKFNRPDWMHHDVDIELTENKSCGCCGKQLKAGTSIVLGDDGTFCSCSHAHRYRQFEYFGY